jgi:hypothetical protein
VDVGLIWKVNEGMISSAAVIVPLGLIEVQFGPRSRREVWEGLSRVKDKVIQKDGLLLNEVVDLEAAEEGNLYPGSSGVGLEHLKGQYAVLILAKRVIVVAGEETRMLKVLVPTDTVTYPSQVSEHDKTHEKLLLHTTSMQPVFIHGAVRWVWERWVDISHGSCSLKFTGKSPRPNELYSEGVGTVTLSFRPTEVLGGYVVK